MVAAGATGIQHVVPRQYLDAVIESYKRALRQTFYIALAMSCSALIGALTVEWKKTRGFDRSSDDVETGAIEKKSTLEASDFKGYCERI